MPEPEFDPDAKEQALASAAQAWDTTQIGTAAPGDVPTVDLTRIHTPEGFASAAERLGGACRTVGFFYLTGHSLPSELRRLALDEARRFHALPDTTKAALRMDLPGRPQGIGYLEVGHRKLPRRRQGNQNAAFIVKRDIDLSLADNLWPAEDDLPDFRRNIEHVAAALEQVALGLLPLFARALKMPRDFFAPAFEDPLYRLRLTRYPRQNEGYGIAPHVDTTFITLLLSTSPGLVIYQPRRREWIRVPPPPAGLIINTGELLKQWSNDEFQSVRHFVEPQASGERFSVPFFVNATSNYPMACIPSCCSPTRPPRYPPISYRESQGAVQGE